MNRRDPWHKKKVWWLESLQGKTHVLTFNKKVNIVRAKFEFLRLQRPEASVKELHRLFANQ